MVDKLINLLESIRGVEEFRTYEQELRYGRERLELPSRPPASARSTGTC